MSDKERRVVMTESRAAHMPDGGKLRIVTTRTDEEPLTAVTTVEIRHGDKSVLVTIDSHELLRMVHDSVYLALWGRRVMTPCAHPCPVELRVRLQLVP